MANVVIKGSSIVSAFLLTRFIPRNWIRMQLLIVRNNFYDNCPAACAGVHVRARTNISFDFARLSLAVISFLTEARKKTRLQLTKEFLKIKGSEA